MNNHKFSAKLYQTESEMETAQNGTAGSLTVFHLSERQLVIATIAEAVSPDGKSAKLISTTAVALMEENWRTTIQSKMQVEPAGILRATMPELQSRCNRYLKSSDTPYAVNLGFFLIQETFQETILFELARVGNISLRWNDTLIPADIPPTLLAGDIILTESLRMDYRPPVQNTNGTYHDGDTIQISCGYPPEEKDGWKNPANGNHALCVRIEVIENPEGEPLRILDTPHG